MKTVAEVIGVSRSNLVERLQQRPLRRIGRPALLDKDLVAQIKAALAEAYPPVRRLMLSQCVTR